MTSQRSMQANYPFIFSNATIKTLKACNSSGEKLKQILVLTKTAALF